MRQTENRELILFPILAITLSSLICSIAYQTDNSGLSLFSVFTPSVLAFIFTLIASGKKGIYSLFVKQTIKRASPLWLIISLAGIPFIGLMAVLTSNHFDFSQVSLRNYDLMPQMLVIILIALGEEYGWRGFLLPRLLRKFSLFWSSIILGLIWGMWHFPAYLIGKGVPQQMNFLVFMFWVILGSLFIGWIYFYTGSVLTSILAHISANVAFNYLFLLPEFTGSMQTFHIFLIYMTAALAIILTTGRKDLLKSANRTKEY